MIEITKYKAPDHLNRTGCWIQYSEGKGRGVYASYTIPGQTVIEISPVLFFGKDEYNTHGKHTVLDHYTFKWRDGRFALALGLGSLFNHSEAPNVSYSLDTETDSIRFTTTRVVSPGEELCIFYGPKLWFEPSDSEAAAARMAVDGDIQDDGWGGLSAVSVEHKAQRRAKEVVPYEDLPFTRISITPDDDEEEEVERIRTTQAWVVDIPDPRHITTMLQYLKQNDLDTPSLSHLKRIRKNPDSNKTSLLLSTSPEAPVLPLDFNLSTPYLVPIPLTPALTLTSQKLKSSFWPTAYTPSRKHVAEEWTQGRVRWACDAMRLVIKKAFEAKAKGELPIVACVPPPYEDTYMNMLPGVFSTHDTRTSTGHPLRHAVLNVVRLIGDQRASPESTPSPIPTATLPLHSVDLAVSREGESRNGTNYLLTALTLFTTHEPCVMCSMALLHSRVKEVIYLIPMARTGGCGSIACLPKLEGVNHRFGIYKWKEWKSGIEVQDNVDA